MGLVRYSQTTHTAGEFSPLLEGQTGFDRYYAALKTLRNMVVLPYGPTEKRGGLQGLGAANLNSAGTTRLIEFVASETDAMVIEIDTDNIRFWKNGAQIESGGSPYELTSFVSTADELFEMDYEQEGNSIYFFHPNFYPRRLRRTADDDWTVSNTPLVTEPFVEDSREPAANLTLSATTGSAITVTASAAAFLSGDVYRFIRAGGGYGVITGYTSTTQVTVSVLADFASTSISSGDWELYGGQFDATLGFGAISGDPIFGRTVQFTTSNPCWRSDDVGKYIGVYDGVCRITSYTSSTVVDAVIVTSLSDKTTGPSNWVLYQKAWAAAGDYPACGTFHEGRLVFAGASDTSANKNRLFLSRSNDYTRFDIGANDSDGMSVTLGGKANQIRWVQSARDLMIGTVGDERSLSGAQGGPLTPSSIESRVRTRWGSAQVKPVLLGNEVVFSQRSRKTIRNSVFSFQQDTYASEELSFYASHISEKQVKEMALQEDPRTVCWMVMEDGTLAGMSYKPEQSVLGWHLHTTAYSSYQASIESVAVIPGTQGDEVWVAVRRRTGPSTYAKRIERINDDGRNAYLDAWVKVTNSPASTTVSGLPSFMDGLTVAVFADGATHPDKTVSSGSITLDREAEEIYVGFPFQARHQCLEPEGGIGNGNSQGIDKRVSKVMARVYDSGVFKVNGDYVPWRKPSDPMDSAVPNVTGDVFTDSGTSYDEKGKIDITSDLPVPLTIVMTAMHLTASMKT